MTNDKEHKEIINRLTDLRLHAVSINEHLKQLNGKIMEHDSRLKEVENKINVFDRRMAYYSGGVAVIVFLVNLLFKNI